MAAQALYRKWRSQTFDEVVGQEHVTLTLQNALRDGRMSHAYLLTGPRGTGKTSTARIIAKALNCLADNRAVRPCNECAICKAITEGRQLDLIEIDAASNRGIDEIRDLREKIAFRPNEARYKVYIIDEVHMLTKEAFNALLKTLEEPPEHAVFVLATTEPERVPETVRSRCQRFDFRRIPTREIVGHLQARLETEGARAAEDALVAIARRSTGSMRDAISLLDQLLSYGDDLLTLERVDGVLGLVDAQMIGTLADCLARSDSGRGLELINQFVTEGIELGQLVDQVVAHLRAVLVAKVTRSPELLDLPREVVELIVRQADAFDDAALLRAINAFIEARSALRDQVPGVPQLPIELAFLRAVTPVTEQRPLPAATVPGPAAPAPAAPAPSQASAAAPKPAPAVVPAGAMAPESAEPRSEFKPTPPDTASAGVGTPETLLQRVQRDWDPLLSQVGKRCGMKVQAALRSVRHLDVAGETLILQFSHAFARDLVNDPSNRSQVEGLWQEHLGSPVRIRCLLPGEKAEALGARGAAAEDDPLLNDARSMGAVIRRQE